MILGKKIKIRLLKEKDLDLLFPLLQKSVYKYEGFLDKLEPEHILYERFKRGGFWEDDWGMMLIIDRKDNILGALNFKKSNLYNLVDVKYVIFDEEDRNKGYMKEALSLFSSYLFSTKQINRVQLAIPDYHRASIAVAQKCGYKFEGIFKGATFTKGKYIDLCIYAMLRDEVEFLMDKALNLS